MSHLPRAVLFGLLWASALPASAADVDFNRDIRPLLSNNCFQCHGPDAKKRQAGLRLDQRKGALAEAESGERAIVPGKPDESELVRRITAADEDERMPPVDSGKQLTPAEIQLLTQWVRQGGKYAKHWSYAAPVRSQPPKVQNAAWPKNKVDYFVLARLEHEGLEPASQADRNAIIRRLSLNLTGLPPTLDEVDQFLGDLDPKAYQKLVDRLLAKKTYGEHWARMWLDLARYADSAGYADDPARTIWAYRDWVISALNDNKPFDQFSIEQIAGDLLPSATEDQLRATAFHRNTLTNNEGGTNDEEFRNVAIVDRVNTTMAVWMGTTMACAQCHSHKFDPISQEEYFRFFAVFNNSEDADRRDESPLIKVWSEEQKQQRSAWQEAIAQLEKKLSVPPPELQAAQAKWEKGFQAELQWQTLKPAAANAKSSAKATIGDDNSVTIDRGGKTDVYTLEFQQTSAGRLAAIRLETLPLDSLPGKGPGHAGGNFVVSRVNASVVPPDGASLNGRYVRIEIPGKQKILSLAEVQVLSGSDNLALTGEAKQSTTAFEGPPRLAIDGNTDGNYTTAKSTTHTAISDTPWWEIDLKSTRPIDGIVIWNRTDGGDATAKRLNNFRISVLDEKRQSVWQQDVTKPPKPKAEFSLSGVRNIPLAAAFADFSQPGFDAANVINNRDVKNKGWAVGSQFGKPHALTLLASTSAEVPAGATLRVVIEQLSKHENHTIGRLRISVTSDERAARYAQTPAPIVAILNTTPGKRSDAQKSELAKYYLSIAPELKADREQLAKLKKQVSELKPITTVPVMRELAANRQRKTHIQHRGNFLDRGKEVTPGLPGAFYTVPESESINRLALARWLVDKSNPLTARVIVNRYWEAIFGVGLVRTSEDFGSQGELPSHPELLDWLATELIRLDWDTKALVKLLVTSAAYRQSSAVTPELYERDPDNRLLARGPRFRLSAEMIRDQALFVSGLLSPKMYGPPVKPPQPQLGVKAAFGSGIDWQTSKGEDRYRRGLYTTWRRSNPYPSMVTFDAPNREVCTIRRDRTNTPLQALVTLNDPVYVEAAQALGRRMAAAGESTADKATFGFRTCLARPPSDAELNHLVQLYKKAHERFAKDPEKAKQMATVPLGAAPEGSDLVDLAAWTVVGNVLLNLDEMFLKR